MDWHLIFVDNKRKEINENEVQRAISRVTRGRLDKTWHPLNRPSYLKIPGGPKVACAALSRRAINGPCAVMMYHGRRLSAVWWLVGPLMARARRAI